MFKGVLLGIGRDRVLFALTLMLVALLVLRAARAEPYGSAAVSQRWGCPKGHVEYEKGCYDPITKTYTHGKRIVPA
jgi:hypothetical protein